MTMKKDDKKVFEREIEDYRDQVWGCARCNWCQNQWGWNVKSAEFSEICPAFHEYRFFPYSGMGKMHIARALLEGDFDYEDAPELAEFIYTCTTCGACEMNCQRLQDKEPLQVNETLRARFVRDGIGPMPAHKGLIKSVKNYDNPWMQPRSQRDRWAKKLSLKDVAKEQAETLFFVGCTTAFDNTHGRCGAEHGHEFCSPAGSISACSAKRKSAAAVRCPHRRPRNLYEPCETQYRDLERNRRTENRHVLPRLLPSPAHMITPRCRVSRRLRRCYHIVEYLSCLSDHGRLTLVQRRYPARHLA